MGRIWTFVPSFSSIVRGSNPAMATAGKGTPWARRRPALRRRFATSAAGAKERVARLGAHRQMRDDAAPGPLTQASAAQPPGRPGREGARRGGSTRALLGFGGAGSGPTKSHHRSSRSRNYARCGLRPVAVADELRHRYHSLRLYLIV